MVVFALKIKATLENLTNLQPSGRNYDYLFKIECLNCHERTSDFVCLRLSDPVIKYKCKSCFARGRVELTGGVRPLTFDESQQGEWIPLMLFACDGFEPLEFIISGKWQAIRVRNGQVIEVKFSSGLFSDDGDIDPVAIRDLEWRFTQA